MSSEGNGAAASHQQRRRRYTPAPLRAVFLRDRPVVSFSDMPSRKPEPPDTSPKTVTGYHVKTDLKGSTNITLMLRKGGTVELKNLDATKALLYLDLLRNSGRRIHAVWDPVSGTLDWQHRSPVKR